VADLTQPAVCHLCGEPKDLPLGRCAACGRVPVGADRDLALLCSIQVLDRERLVEVQARLRRGEPLRPSAALRERAREVLRGGPPPEAPLGPRRILALAAANLLLTPLVGYAVWFRLRTRPGPAGRQALLTTMASSVVLFVLLLLWRLRAADQLAHLLSE
jgi:hypothetical protein